MINNHGIVFMGTPEFAVEPLKKLIDLKYNIKAVITVADKPSGRGLKLNQSPIKVFALQNNIQVLQPIDLEDAKFIAELSAINADLFIVVAFRKLPDAVWQIPRLGCFNLHASLLPLYRGAAPINHAIMNGETKTGVTTFFLNSGIDTGKMIMQREINIGPDETAGELHDKLKYIGADIVAETVQSIYKGNIVLKDQPPINPGTKKAPKLFRPNCLISWNRKVSEVHNLIRGLSPYPGAYSLVETSEAQKEIKILRSKLTGIVSNEVPGKVIIDQNRILVACKEELLEILVIQSPGKKPMFSSDFLRGSKYNLDSFISS